MNPSGISSGRKNHTGERGHIRQGNDTKKTPEPNNLKKVKETEIRSKIRELDQENEMLRQEKGEAEVLLCRYSDFFLFAPVGLFCLNENGIIIEVNLAASHLLGMKKHLLIKRHFGFFVGIDSKDQFDFFFRKLLEEGTTQSCELVLLKNREAKISVFIEGIAAETKSALARQCLLAITDISRRKLVEEEILTLNSELEEKLRERTSEVEAFSYSVSQELKEPLHQIEGFTKALADDFPEYANSSGGDYISRILTATGRISALINGLMWLSRLSSWELKTSDADLTSFAKSIADELKAEFPGRPVEVVIAEGVKVKGDPGMLRVVLQNLLGNSWKFTEKNPLAKIEFGVFNLKGKAVYFVRDNGAGFDMAYSEKLFMPLHRLHQRTAFPGLGIGLATTKRIIERHGGRIWAESTLEKGATFYFTLPNS